MTQSSPQIAATDTAAAAEAALALVDQALTAYERPDLLEVARAARTSETVIVVAGQFKAGKSTLVNALIGGAASPTNDDLSTAVPIMFRHSTELSVVAHRDEGDESFPVAQLPSFATEQGDRVAGTRFIDIAFGRMHQGFAIVDTPGMGGLTAKPLLTLLGLLPTPATHLVVVTTAAQPLTRSELEVCRSAAELGRSVTVVVNKIDLHPAWQDVVDTDRAILGDHGLTDDLLPVSALLAAPSKGAAPDPARRTRSRIDDLVHALGFHRSRYDRALAAAANAIDAVVATFRMEHDALADDEAFEQAAVAARAARSAAEERKRAVAGWSGQFNEQVSDLAGEVDYAWRSKSRELQREFDDAIDQFDPADSWAEFEAQVYSRTAEAVCENWRQLHDGLDRIADDIAAAIGYTSPEHLDAMALMALDEVHVDASLEVKAPSAMDRTQSAMRSLYSNMGIVGSLTAIVGLTLAAPVTVVVGALLGRRNLREEKERQLTQRRSQAKTSTRRYLDDVSFVYSKELHTAITRRQRQLRQQLAGWAERAMADAQAQLTALQKAAPLDETQRIARRADIEAELARLAVVAQRIEAARGGGS